MRLSILPVFFVFLLWAVQVNAQPYNSAGKDGIVNSIRNTNSLSEKEPKIDSLLFISSYYVNKPGSEVADMRAATNYADQALKLSLKLQTAEGEAKCYTVLSQISRESNRETEGLRYIRKALRIIDKHPAPASASKAYFEIANYYTIYADTSLVKKIGFYATGLKYFEATNPPTARLADVLKMMGDLYQFHGEYTKSLPCLKRSLALYRQVGFKNLQDIYALLGNVLIELHDMKEGIRYNLLGVKLLEDAKDSTMTACQAYFNLGFAYGTLKDYNNALIYMLKANKVALSNKDSTAAIVTDIEIGNTYRWLHQPQKALRLMNGIENWPAAEKHQMQFSMLRLKIYNEAKQFEKAALYYKKLTQDIEGHDITFDLVQNARIVLLEYLVDTKQFKEVNDQLPRLLALPLINSRPAFHLNLETLAYKADSAQGNYKSAMLHLTKAMDLKIAALKSNYDDQVGKLQVEFDLNKKDQDIAFQSKSIGLLTRKNELQKNALHDQRLIRNLIIAGAALLSLFLILLFNRYQIKKRANEDLKEQQEEINTQNDYLKQLVSEREWLLKEIHHRVKNNLQIVISLLNSELFNVKDVVAKHVIRESQLRMHSISLIHQKLYQHQNVSSINMKEYIHDMVNFLQDSFDSYGKIKFSLDIDPVYMDVSQAVPAGLILNESITNIIKYAFNDKDQKGNVRISLKQCGAEILELIIHDNGCGLPPGFNPEESASLGMRLITGLTGQLKGSVDFVNDQGLCMILQVPINPGLSFHPEGAVQNNLYSN
ncbi:sensor histidine kinase [Mucilaginibacter rubeus]|uniref:histidine kinase n=1 Tax=Mucilaginibacter rubeus TaxID=2027860 RepID=A0A5C1I1N9_9SPHI|nr:sensor histidine kinase [Mucilaginibacter rubeus]QEM11716.1 sensor histidine kinase [Mucilaginibacter rubeus]